jgi:hypothetical protein
MVIFHSYVCLPEGIYKHMYPSGGWANQVPLVGFTKGSDSCFFLTNHSAPGEKKNVSSIWVNYNISLTWIKAPNFLRSLPELRPFGDDFLLNHDSSEGEQGSGVIIYPDQWNHHLWVNHSHETLVVKSRRIESCCTGSMTSKQSSPSTNHQSSINNHW